KAKHKAEKLLKKNIKESNGFLDEEMLREREHYFQLLGDSHQHEHKHIKEDVLANAVAGGAAASSPEVAAHDHPERMRKVRTSVKVPPEDYTEDDHGSDDG
ncbi:unnamed protein product, partial [Amoebophrya sp. A25]